MLKKSKEEKPRAFCLDVLTENVEAHRVATEELVSQVRTLLEKPTGPCTKGQLGQLLGVLNANVIVLESAVTLLALAQRRDEQQILKSLRG